MSITLTDSALQKLLALSTLRGLLTDEEKALVLIRDYKYSIRSAAKQFGIPYSRLHHIVSTNNPLPVMGRPRKLKHTEEKRLADWVKAKARQGDSATMAEILNQVCFFSACIRCVDFFFYYNTNASLYIYI